MPKIVDIDKEKIISITKELITNKKYEEINCRNIAKYAGIGVGTLYNYFDSKATILALVMLDDWKECIRLVDRKTTLEKGVRSLYENIKKFSSLYFDLWNYQRKRSSEYIDYFMTRHNVLISQINSILEEILTFNNLEVSLDTLNFLSDNIARYASQLYDYNRLEKIFINIIRRVK